MEEITKTNWETSSFIGMFIQTRRRYLKILFQYFLVNVMINYDISVFCSSFLASHDKLSSMDRWSSKLESSNWLSHVRDALNCACLTAQCLDQVRKVLFLSHYISIFDYYLDDLDFTGCVTSIGSRFRRNR